ncbi:hypothetical protein M409DRAFT_51721 [Zasmidium cellare ATCC 36951]|uniref:Uncharacterized protein n=1 Tax=Zasmidium cellare ATCC 36951 TaxID=1080233 RepID=A0A6A6CUR9_ZASCE|nr:uncharacterized protein M409DRAFT_51721 [Zasmidium cellare ATCC 36951]KAF2169930.1 hypothetical protein M409DRAFT_51721 [Zasmidium cellare ATCC 36951]
MTTFILKNNSTTTYNKHLTPTFDMSDRNTAKDHKMATHKTKAEQKRDIDTAENITQARLLAQLHSHNNDPETNSRHQNNGGGANVSTRSTIRASASGATAPQSGTKRRGHSTARGGNQVSNQAGKKKGSGAKTKNPQKPTTEPSDSATGEEDGESEQGGSGEEAKDDSDGHEDEVEMTEDQNLLDETDQIREAAGDGAGSGEESLLVERVDEQAPVEEHPPASGSTQDVDCAQDENKKEHSQEMDDGMEGIDTRNEPEENGVRLQLQIDSEQQEQQQQTFPQPQPEHPLQPTTTTTATAIGQSLRNMQPLALAPVPAAPGSLAHKASRSQEWKAWRHNSEQERQDVWREIFGRPKTPPPGV